MGDKLLSDFAILLRENCRKNDVVGRYGGEEFVIGAPEIDKKETYSAIKLKDKINSYKFLGDNGKTVGITFSAGVASQPGDGATLTDLLKKADESMYKAKKKGKNRVEM